MQAKDTTSHTTSYTAAVGQSHLLRSVSTMFDGCGTTIEALHKELVTAAEKQKSGLGDVPSVPTSSRPT